MTGTENIAMYITAMYIIVVNLIFFALSFIKGRMAILVPGTVIMVCLSIYMLYWYHTKYAIETFSFSLFFLPLLLLAVLNSTYFFFRLRKKKKRREDGIVS